MPVQLNEPLNTLQRLCEELEYSELLDKAANTQDPFERMVRWLVFAWISSYVTFFWQRQLQRLSETLRFKRDRNASSCTRKSYLSVFNLGGVLCCSIECGQNRLYLCCFYIILVFRGPWPSIYYPERARRCALPPLGFPYRHMEWQEVPRIVNWKTCNRSWF